MTISETQYRTKMNMLVFACEQGMARGAATIFNQMVAGGLSPQGIETNLSGLLYIRHGEKVQRYMATLTAGKSIFPQKAAR